MAFLMNMRKKFGHMCMRPCAEHDGGLRHLGGVIFTTMTGITGNTPAGCIRAAPRGEVLAEMD
jgi:hypothetical protein